MRAEAGGDEALRERQHRAGVVGKAVQQQGEIPASALERGEAEPVRVKFDASESRWQRFGRGGHVSSLLRGKAAPER